MIIRIGLPYPAAGALCRTAEEVGAATLISANSMWRAGRGFGRVGEAAWRTPSALDSTGFTAMRLGGYRWTVAEYVRFVVTRGGQPERPFPWQWWAAMDYCCESEIAANRAEVERRITLTVDAYTETLDELDRWRAQGVADVPDPMPTLQGRTPDDYLSCAERLARVCRGGRLPALVGVGSVCRRPLHGPEGLLTVLEVLDRELPAGTRLHLFGVKGALLPHLGPYVDRVASVDSMAWDSRARHEARDAGLPFSSGIRSEHLRRWYQTQLQALPEAAPQLALFGGAP